MKKLILTAALAVVVAGSASAGPNLLVNGGFEAGLAGWTAYGGGGVNGGAFGMDPCEGSMMWDVVRSYGNTPGNNTGHEGVAQQVILNAGTYVLTACGQSHNKDAFVYINNDAPTYPDGFVQLVVDTTGGVDVTAATDYSALSHAGAKWDNLSLQFTVANAGPVSIFLDSQQPWAFAGNWSGFDNAYLDVVPEPSSILAMASGLLGMVGVAFRKRG